MTWIRLHVDSLHNRKLLALDDKAFRVWVNCLLAGCTDGGKLVLSRSLCLALHLRNDHLKDALSRLVAAGLMTRDGDTYQIYNWNKRQYLDNVNERVKQHRERKKASDVTLHVTGNVTEECNEKNRYGNGRVTASETDTDNRAENRAAAVQFPKQKRLPENTAALDWNGPDPTVEISKLMAELACTWPEPGDVPRAITCAEREWAKSGTDLIEWCGKLRRSEAVWRAHHQGRLAVRNNHFVPHLLKWIQDGDYARTPPKAPAPVVHREDDLPVSSNAGGR